MTIYETDAHRAAERAAADRLETAWHCRLLRFPALCPVDYFAEQEGRVVALVEIKCRQRRFADYPDIYLDLLKWWEATRLARPFGAAALFAVQCSDALVYCDLNEVEHTGIVLTGRKDRNDPSDIRPVIRIPLENFRAVE